MRHIFGKMLQIMVSLKSDHLFEKKFKKYFHWRCKSNFMKTEFFTFFEALGQGLSCGVQNGQLL